MKEQKKKLVHVNYIKRLNDSYQLYEDTIPEEDPKVRS